jgi:AcrR family transcriptional regulator
MLQDSILQLIREMDYEQITIEDITERVNLGRTTFYLHYRDKNELMQDSLGNLWDDIFREIYSEKNVRRWRTEGLDPRRLMFAHLAENADLYRLLFRGKIGGEVLYNFRQRLNKIFIQAITNWQILLQLTPSLPNTVTSNYISGAVIGLMTWWLDEDLPCTADEIFEIYNQMNVSGPAQAIGLPVRPQKGSS